MLNRASRPKKGFLWFLLQKRLVDMYPYNPYDPWLLKFELVADNCFAVFVREKFLDSFLRA